MQGQRGLAMTTNEATVPQDRTSQVTAERWWYGAQVHGCQSAARYEEVRKTQSRHNLVPMTTGGLFFR